MPIDEAECNPYLAMTQEKSPEELADFNARFDALRMEQRDRITSVDTTKKIFQLLESHGVPEQFTVAIAKIVGFIVLGDVPPDQVSGLLAKLEVPAADSLVPDLLNIATVPEPPVPQSLKPLPPLTVQRPATSGPNTPPRNIIDLRKPPEAT